MNSFETPLELNSPTGAILRLHELAPEKPPRAIVQINHGLAEHSARYGRFARHLADNGFAVFAHDHRGHGGTRAPDAPQGVFAKGPAGQTWPAVISDVAAVVDHAAERFPGVPVVVFGHSLGGNIAANFALSHPSRLAGLAIWNSNFQLGLAGRIARGVLSAERMLLGSDVPSRILPRTTFEAWGKSIPNARTGFDWLSHDADQVQAYVDDPLCGWDASVSLWQDLFALAYRAADQRALSGLPKSLPVMLVGGGQDPVTANGTAIEWYSKRLSDVGFKSVETRIYKNLRHETLNETAADALAAMDEFTAWAKHSVADADDSGPPRAVET